MSDKTIQDDLGLDSGSTDGPVECFGQKFESDEARREHYLELLAEKLKDPEFRNQPGFPIGKDEDILALSDPPYFTLCPNPWLESFTLENQKFTKARNRYHRDPYVADISEGKNHKIYNAHSYHTKVPHRAIMRYILHYTDPGDVVLDLTSGTGMTGVAARMCGDVSEVRELGYLVAPDGSINLPGSDQNSAVGARRAILQDLSPAASLIASNYNLPIDIHDLQDSAAKILDILESELRWMFTTIDPDTNESLPITYTIWSDVFTCPECAADIVFWDAAVDPVAKKVRDQFTCESCGKSGLTKSTVDRKHRTDFDPRRGKPHKTQHRIPVEIQFIKGRVRKTKRPDDRDLRLLEKIDGGLLDNWFPNVRIDRDIDLWYERDYTSLGVDNVNDFFFSRTLHVLGKLRQLSRETRDPRLRLALTWLQTSVTEGSSLMNRERPGGMPSKLSGTLYIGALIREIDPIAFLRRKLNRLKDVSFASDGTTSLLSTGSSCSKTSIPEGSIDYVFIDPPFGSNIIYSDLSILWESWINVFTNTNEEAVVHRRKKESPSTLADYQEQLLQIFEEVYRVLKPGRWATIEFSNTKAAVWNAIQVALQRAGLVVANVSILDKKQGSFKAVTTPTAVKQDLIISAYKPDGQLEISFSKNYESPQGVWDFMDYHLTKLPVSKARGGQLEFIAERDPRILFDRAVAFFVSHERSVPISSAEFQEELQERYAERDGMVFLAEQVAEFDSTRARIESVGQMSIFVDDEKSAIDWLRGFLKRRPSIYKDIQPEFLQQLSLSWKKWEDKNKLADLSFLLNQVFLQYKGEGPVPSQIHNYLSTQFKNLRNLGKEDSALKAKAMDRWYVPDPSKQKDMDELRERRLLEEFWSYLPPNYVPPALSSSTGGDDLPGLKFQIPKIPKGKKMKELRTEAIRAGFRFCYQKKDYQTMLVAAQIIPDAVIEEDEQLQMFYDTAVTRSGVED